MQTRISMDPVKHSSVLRAMRGLGTVVRESGLESSLLHLIKLRVSQINGCGYCLDMHSKDARAEGESEQRLYLLQAWREAPLYSARERAALAWAEAVTNISTGPVPDAVYDDLRAAFTEEEIVALTLAIVEINGWNRFAISLNRIPGTYRVGEHG
jgi:AhpD family alkylhydroperoxidase